MPWWTSPKRVQGDAKCEDLSLLATAKCRPDPNWPESHTNPQMLSFGLLDSAMVKSYSTWVVGQLTRMKNTPFERLQIFSRLSGTPYRVTLRRRITLFAVVNQQPYKAHTRTKNQCRFRPCYRAPRMSGLVQWDWHKMQARMYYQSIKSISPSVSPSNSRCAKKLPVLVKGPSICYPCFRYLNLSSTGPQHNGQQISLCFPQNPGHSVFSWSMVRLPQSQMSHHLLHPPRCPLWIVCSIRLFSPCCSSKSARKDVRYITSTGSSRSVRIFSMFLVFHTWTVNLTAYMSFPTCNLGPWLRTKRLMHTTQLLTKRVPSGWRTFGGQIPKNLNSLHHLVRISHHMAIFPCFQSMYFALLTVLRQTFERSVCNKSWSQQDLKVDESWIPSNGFEFLTCFSVILPVCKNSLLMHPAYREIFKIRIWKSEET